MSSAATLTQLTPAQRRELLKMARARDLVGDPSELPPIEPAAREGRLPLSFAQERLWFIDRLEPGSAVYNIPVAWRLGGALDEAALERSLGEIVRRHEALRTVFAEVDGSPVQVIAPFGGFVLPVEDLSALGEADREAAVGRRAGEEARRAFDLSAGPLFRASLLRLGAEDHVLLLTVHHIVSDGWSLGVLYRELSALYAAYHEGRESPLPELAVQYADYAVWQREQLKGAALDRQLGYWRERLADAPALLELPTDHPRPAVQTFRGAHERIELPLELLERLQALGRSEGATLHMTLLGAFQVLLSKYSGSEDIVVGSLGAGRTRKEVEETIGFFVNTLVLRTDLAGDPGFREVLRRAREVTLGAYEHQEVPFERLVAELQPERSLSHTPFFQVMFAVQNAVERGVALPGLAASEVGAELASAKFDLFLTARATAQGLRVGLNYSTDLFEHGTALRMLGHLARVLEQVAADADVRLSELELLGEAERALVLEAWNRTAAEVPADRCIHELFEAQAARTPGAVAIRFEEESLTYAELNTRANRLAHHLRRLGVGPEVRVGVLMERSLEMVVSLLAVLKAGGAYVPLDPGLPAERLAYMLDDSAVPLVLVQAAVQGAVPAREGVGVLAVDALAERLAAEPAENPAVGAGPDSLAYVIYTSGSTGRPKGVMNAHRGVVNRLVWMQAQFGIGADDVVLQKTPFGFDVSVWELFWPLQQGARLVMARPDGHRDPAYLGEVIEREGVTTLHFVPSMLQPFVEAVEAGRCASLRHVVCSGEALPPALVRRFYDRFAGPVVLTNLYGPTEAAVDVSCWACAREDAAGVVPIGRPVWNTRLYVLDAALKPVPLGVPGELYIGGVQVARGYQGRATMTAERFVPDPFSTEGGARLYRTGDRARWRADGAIEYLGRLDFQVKIRGFRIELGEIEAALRPAPGVRDCAVVAREDETGDRRLVAYVVGAVEADTLRAHLGQSLPEYMVPAAFVSLERLPLTANGKLDRKALPAPEGDVYARGSYEAPLGEVEAALAEIWGEVLGVERVGRWDHFFELGGHSLLAIKLIGRMRRAGLYADVRALFTTPVLAELALAVGRSSSEVEIPANGIPQGCESLTPEMLPLVELSPAEINRIVAGVPGGAANVQDIYPLAPLQEGFLFHHLLSQVGDPYLTSSVTEFDTRARLERYLAALQAVIDRHDILRTAVAWEGLREPVQVVWRHAPLPVDEVQLDAQAEDVAEQLWRRHDPRRYRMDLTRAPLLRVCIADDRARGRWLLLMLKHHLTGDHESVEVLREEISAHLLGVEAELPAPLPFRNYVAQARLGVSRDEHERFFRGMLGDVDEPTAPYGLLDVWGEGQGIEEARLPVAGDLGARLRRRARVLGVSAASLCHLAWAQVLARLSGRADVVFGTLLFGRMQGGEGTDRVMGPFINTLPVRIGVGEEGAEVAVRRTHALLADLLRHEHASLALAQRSSGVAAPAPLFTSLLNYRYGGGTTRSREAGQPGEGVRGIRVQERTNYPVALSVDDRGEEFSLSAQVAVPAEAERVCRMMHTALERLVEALELSPRRAIGSIDVLPEAERRQVVEEWNRAEAEYPAGSCIHELFEQQAERTPGAVAVRFDDESLTYRALNERANRMAHHLAGLGVRPETRVGICLERGTELVVAILAVLKAGGAWVPLDPSYPAERLAFMLADSGAPLLLTRLPLPEGLAPDGVEVVCLDADRERIEAGSAEAPAAGVLPGNLAYVIYTSGSTGRPKGVLVPHRGLANVARGHARDLGVQAGDRVLQFASPSFDASVFEMVMALAAGATLVLGTRETLAPGPDLLRLLRDEEVTVATLPPSALAVLPPAELPALRTLMTAGEALPAELVERWAPGRRFFNLYGPTEATIWSTTAECAPGGGRPPIGHPVANTRAYVLDARGEPVPVGVPGELYVGGAGVSRGYAGRPGLTAERFVPDPFGAAGGRLYRTGDRVRWSAGGELEFLGRVDEQVKLRGFRIEPGEIEGALRRSEGVDDCAVVAREDVPGDKRLVAYVVGDVEAGALREHLLRELPEYMVPSAFVPLEALPLTPNGKVDRKALPAPEYAADADRYVAPRTPTEEVLAEIWAETLRLERVGVTESFFELGGHSLLATRVVSRVRQLFGVEVPLRALFEGPTVAELAGRVEEMRRAELPVLPPVVPTERTGALPLSFAQERLWFLDRLEPGSTTYNIPAARRLGGALDEAALERALGEIIRRHEPLRTVFAEADGSPVQVIAPFGGFTLPVDDLSGLAEADREAAVRRRAGEEAARAFDLSAGPLFRAALLRLGEEEHVLLLSMHHIVSDGWSMGVLFRELSALYAAYREGGESPLPDLPVQYADYALWQREQLEGEVLDRQLAYWRERLAGAPELLELPTDHPRPAVQTHRGDTVPVELSPELLERLQALRRSEGTTLYMTLLGAFQVLLSKYSGSDDIVVGSPIAGRTQKEVEELIGFFVNTLVLRTDLSGDPSFREVLRRSREVTLGAYEHQEVPFERLVAELQPERTLSHAPLFQVMFTLQNTGRRGDALAGLSVSGVGAELASARFDLSLELAATARGVRGALSYSTDLFERGTALRMVGHLERVLEQVAADADVRLSELDLLSAAERSLVVDAWNATEAEYPADRCIHELFEAQAARTPGAVAVTHEGASLSYVQLNERANRLAHHLIRRGVGPEVRVGLCLERSLEMVVSILAVLKAGGAYVPLDPAYPPDRLAFTLSDAGVPVLLAQETVRATLAVPDGVELISLDAAQAEIAAECGENPVSGATPEGLAYVIYTSGSTGAPKGALIEHRNVARLFAATEAWFDFGPDDVWTLFHSYAFDFSVWELWGALLYGGRVVVVPFDVSRDPEVFHALVRREGVTVLSQTPSAFRQFIRVDGERGGELALRVVVFGGEALEPASLREWVERRGAETPRLVNMYGITETTVHVTYRPLSREDVFGGSGSPIGRAIPGLRLYVLDPARRPVPVGVPGELYVGGAGVARGYLNRPELTAARFVDDPFAPGRLYRTGDRVRWMADGALEYLGRLDEQVKIRGFRIELGEIEVRLAEHPEVREAVVLAREDVPGDRRLVAYVVGAVEADALRAHMRQGLPEYMVPSAFVVLDRLPLTANGKVDRKALPAPDLAWAEERYVGPRTPVEEVLAGIWAEVLRLERVGVEESFFELGGHSLLAIRMLARIRAVFSVELPLRALFEGPTVAELAGRVEEIRRAELPVLPPVVPVERDGALPLSFAQERLWFIDRLEPESAAYNVPVVWRVGGALDVAALERALGEIVRRHEALRTVFTEVDGSPVQVIAPYGGFTLPVEDLSGLSEQDREAAVRRRAGEEARRAFDLSAGPLFRAALLRLGAEDHVLLLCMHHILVDQWSMGVLRRELSTLYAAFRDGGESPLAKLAVQYADYAVWQRGQLRGEILDRHLAYWKERLAGAPELLELPTDRPRPAVQTYRGAREGITLSGELLARLEALGRGEGATLFMTLLAAFQVLLGRYGGSEDVVVGSPISGRTRREVEELIGLFLNTLVLRTDLSGDPGFRETLRRVREMTLGAFEHQEIPFERLVTELQPGRSLSYSPLFQVMFVLQEAERSESSAGNLELRGMGAGIGGTSKFDLTLFTGRNTEGLTATLEYNTDLFDRGTIRRMLGHLKRVLEEVAADADVRLSKLALMEDAERRQVVAEWNATDAAYPRERCAHELFESQAERTPGAVALRHAGGSLTYGELEERANRLARHLRGLGVGPDARVGLCLERGPELMVGVLGILKAGGACVPLDPAYPGERLAYMLEDSAARVLLTQASLVERLPAGGATVVRLDADAGEIGREGGERLEVPVGPGNLAYVIYTSGSTGRPKGVAMPHRPLVNLLAWQEGSGRAPAGAVTLQFTSISFDVSFQEIFATWCAGGTLVLASEEVRADPPRLARLLEAERIERLFLPFIALQHLAEASVELGIAPASLGEVITAGEQLRVTEPIRRWFARMPGCVLVNQYGPSETHVVSARVLEGEPAGWPLLPSIGAPVANTRLYALDPHLEPAPIGVPGELLLGGDAVARGYLGRPGLTAERFVPDPFGGPGGRLYRTGDRARWLPGGEVEYLGRTDEQVKVRGFRIEPGEVEAVLSDHAEVREAVVVVREDAPGDRRLVAYVVAAEPAEVTPAELRAHLKGRLPEYMVPSAVVVLESLPLTPSGKVARRALPAPEYAAAETGHVAPRTPTEEVLAGIWAEVLRLERVGVEESFFELGGHSLLATRVVSRVRQLFGVELPLRALFEGPTVAELAGRVEEMRRAELPVLPPVVPTGRTGPLPLSFAQERLWFIDRLEPGSAVYNMPVAWRLGGALDRAALERSLGEIVRRHEALRTTFAEVDGSPVQVIAPFGEFALPVNDLSDLGEADREAAVRRRAGEEARRPFDLSAGPLFRAALLRLGAEDHVLLLSMHHIVSDGWSMGVFFRELSSLYEAYREGRASPLPELAVQYADYAVWQREQLEGEALERQLSYWRERLAGAPELLELPTDRPRPAVQTFRGATVPVELSPELLARLQTLGRSEGATLYMTLLGAFGVLLSRYGGGDDIVVGSPIAGRTRREVEELIGFFVNTLVLRTDLSGDPSFRETLRRAREATLGAYENQEVPFEKLVAELQPERSLGHSPLFQVMLAVQNAGDGGGALSRLTVSGVGAELASAKFDLSLVLTATAQGLRGGLNYSTDLFERGTVVRMLGHLERVLEQVAADADVRLSRLELLGGAERALVLETWNRTAAEYPAGRCIHELFEVQAARTPGAVAATGGTVALTYAGLNARANRLARHLVRLGVGPEARVGVCLERGPELMVCTLAVLKAGGAYVAMDPAYPPARLELMLRDSGAAVLLTDGRGAAPAGDDGVHVVRVDRDAHAFAAESAADLPNRVSPRNVAYVVYTSGSTGTPKGVAVDHASLGALCAWHVRAFGVTAADRGTQVASPGFDAAVWEVWPYLTRGASVHVAPEEVRADPPALRDWLVEHAATVSFVPTPVAEPMLALEWPAHAALRWLLTGGDRLRARPRAGMPFALVNNYGPTECTVVATSGPVTADGARAPSIGRPIENTRVHVLDAGLRPLPAGVPGELCIGGAQVARGYLNRPALTAERFVPDPFSAEGGARLYRSGDRVRWLPDGTVEYLGRLDEQVKVRGFRIEPAEIEAALRQAPSVGDCAVVARHDETGGRRLVAYVVGEAEAEALRAHLRRSLPEHMVPSAFVFLGALPLTPNGKVDRKALPAPELASAEDRYVAPRTPVEEVLAGIWAEVLRLERVGVEESFFELGGHSLLATRVVSRIRELFGVELPLRALFEGPTVAEMARAVEEMRRAGLPVLPPVVPAGRTGALPLSFAQERLWFIDRLEPGSAVYNIPVARRLGGALDEAALERALGEIVRRHESLRTVFHEVDGSPVQVIAPFGGFALPVEELSELGEADREAALRRRAGEEARRVFDLSAGPLFRAALLRLGAEDHVLLLSMHHIVSDGWSLGVLFRELSALYAAYREGRTSPLPEPGVQYADYAVWQREQLAGEVLDRQLAYWRERLAGAPELLELPTDRPRPAEQTFRGAHERIGLSGELVGRLRALGRSEGATLYMVLLSAFQVLLGKYSGSEDIVVGSPIAGRTRKEVEELIGFFVNTLVLRTDLGGDPRFRETLRRVREATLGAYEHQEVPFEKLVAELQPERSLGHSPLFQVMFSLDDASGADSVLPGLVTGSVGAGMETAKFDLSLGLAEGPGGGWGSLSYNTDLFDRATAERMARHLERVLEQVAAHPDVRLSELDLLDGAERRQVVEEWNATRAPHPASLCIHHLVEAQVERTPNAAAVVFRGKTLTYRELNERANRLARHLRRLGVGPEARVAVCLERGPEMVVAVLATLKAGGAYVPLDPAYPAERLAFMLADSAAAVLLTEEALRGTIPVPAGMRVVCPAVAQTESGENLEGGANPGSLAYVIYTSGSTGTPKGVAVEHRALVNYVVHAAAVFATRVGDRVLQFASISFDTAAEEIFPTLVSGATLVLRTGEMLETPGSFWEACGRWGISILDLPTAVWHQVSPDLDARPGALPESLRLVVIGGEAALPERVRAWQAAAGGRVRLLNGYGPTETTIVATLWEAPESGGVSRVPIGKPVANTRCYVLDAARRPAAVGVPGELYVGGAQVARGYLERPALTAERFVPDPFAAEPGARLYRTGDRVRWRADGELEYLGRLDAQVKVRGFRIELGEIEGALRRSEGVADCVVVAREDVPGEKRLVAYVVGDVEARGLREHLRRELPEYMVPAAFVALERLPLTPNGKLDRKALPAPEGDAYARRGYEAPLGEVEAALAEIWGEVLGVERVGRWDHFFELGGHSLLAIRLIERMRRVGLYMDVRALFTTPVLAELALAVGRASSEVEVPANAIPPESEAITPEMLPLVELSQAEIDRIVAGVPGGAANVQDIYPLAPLQEGIHFHHRLSQEGDPYLLSTTTEFDTRARLDRYLAALQAVIDRHDILRTAVAWEGLREPVQVVWRHAPLPVEEVELDAAEDAAGQLWRRYDPRHYRMELGRAPLLRACIAEDRARGRWLLLMLTHHLTGDHESLEVQREEISAHLRGQEAELPAPLPFRNYVAQARLGVSRDEHERFFRGLLGDVEEPTAPYGLLDVWGEGRGIGEARLQVAGDLGARLRRRARALGVSAASLCHLAWGQVLARLSGRADVVFGTLLFGRMQGGEGTDRVMGPFINTLPVRIGVGEEGVEAAVRRTHALLADLLRHEHASLSLAQRCSGVAAPAPLFTSLLNYRYSGGTMRSPEAGQPRSGVRDLRGQERTNYPVVLSVDDLGDEFSLAAQVAAPAEAERVCRMMHTALERLAEALELAPGRAVGSIDVLPEAERRQVVVEWNRTEAEYPREACVHELFEARAARTPGAVAVVHDDRSLTYAELNARANRLAHHLRALGAGPQARVAILMPRSIELVVSELAVLKAGAAYVPIDPSFPAERIAFMVADSGSPLVLGRTGADLPTLAGVERVDVDALPEGPCHDLRAPLGSGAAAYVMYTSGSTGQPKGVVVPHRAIVRLVIHNGYANFGADDRVAFAANPAFDASTLEVWAPLLSGGRIVVIGQEVLLEPRRFAAALARHEVDVLWMTAGLFHQYADELKAEIPRLRYLIVGGDALDPQTIARVRKGCAPRHLLNGYGPTETTTFAITHEVTDVKEGARSIPLGRPIANTRIYILDARGEPVPAGVAGEMYIGGAGVALGYLNRPGLTAERFVPDPFGGEPGARMYRTGDLGRWLPDGTIEFLGRNDHQVKVRGFRIELGEVEARLLAHPEVREAVVLAREDAPGDRRLVAYVVGADGAEAETLHAHLSKRLPEYMVPAAYVRLDALPLTPNGKVDRRALPAPELAPREERYVAPRTPVEEVLAGIWAEVLRLERVGVHDSFFALGGHSLLIMRLLADIQAAFDLDLSIRTVFSMPTLEVMAEEIERRIYEDVSTMSEFESEFEAERLAEPTPVAGD